MWKKEDYLRIMYQLYLERKEVKSVDISKTLNISKPSVSEMLRKLAKQKLIKVKPYSKVQFTSEGLKYAKRLNHHHETVKRFAKHILKHSEKPASDLAHELEHLSPQSIDRLNKFMDNLHSPPKNLPPYIG
ncbi:MAG: metal-dependent transcriptional regulator [archaeon]